MKRRSESGKSMEMSQVQVLVGPTTINLIEAYREMAGLSSRAQAARALIAQGLLAQHAENE